MKIKVVHEAESQQTQQNQSAQQPQQPANPQPRRKLGCLGKTIIGVGVYFLFCGILGAMMGDMMSTPVTVLEDNTIYRIDLSGVLVDQATEENPFDALLAEMYGQSTATIVGLNDLLSNIALAKDNDKILGIYLRGGSLSAGPASAKALRTIQMNDLPSLDADRRVLGVIRPTVETIGALTQSRHVGVLATAGTIKSESYPLEIKKLYPDVTVSGKACPMWVPLVENGEADLPGADYFVDKYISELLSQDGQIDTVILGCTHYPLLLPKIRSYMPKDVTIVSQGELVASSLEDYLKRHPEMDARCTKQGSCRYLTTEAEDKFAESASCFLNEQIKVERITLE